MKFSKGSSVQLRNGFPVIVTSTYAAHDGQAYRVKTDVSALTIPERSRLDDYDLKPWRLTALESAYVTERAP